MTQNRNTICAATFSGIYAGHENELSRSIEFFHNITQKKSAFDESKHSFNEKIEALKKRRDDVTRTDLIDVANMYRRCMINAESVEEYINSLEGNESKFVVSAMKDENTSGETGKVKFIHEYGRAIKNKYFKNKEIHDCIFEEIHYIKASYFELIDILK
ncbi:hypothetical protein JK182_12915 [Acetobacter okinawensis]|uniref:hypothetical protein n=1 Tax=Acetobacter okinawensis TaxID=1076594 RepID=UPI001BACB44B|nr:hypothetical protein [Acetobacter okinawensis]MBS0989553.1 hypothetical protein [Acetobacter okinawensis]